MGRQEFGSFWVTTAIVAVLTSGVVASPCDVDADCADAVDCNGVETCGYDGQCRPGLGLCDSLVNLPGTAVSASSVYSQGYLPRTLIDGVDLTSSSWCSARNDPAPAVNIWWEIAVEVHEIRALTAWSPSYDFLTGRFRLFDAAGVLLFDSGTVSFTAGEITLPVAPPATGVRRLELVGETWRSADPCLSEIEVDGGLPCATDADCAFSSPCVAVGLCLASGNCSATAPRCRNLAPSNTTLSASSVDAPYFVEKLVDGSYGVDGSWCAAASDDLPTLSVTLPNEHAVHLLRVTNPWTGYEIQTGVVTIEDALGASVLDTGTLTFDHGAIRHVVEPVVTAAHEIRLDTITSSAAPCVGEFEVLGEYCGIAITHDEPLTIAFRPGTPTPDFELRYGTLADLRTDGGFARADCLGRYTAESVTESLPDPEPGAGHYLLARGLNVCTVEGFGMSWATPDPRAALAVTPACQP